MASATTQPGDNAQIDTSNPITTGLVMCGHPVGNVLKNIVSGNTPTVNGTAPVPVTTDGMNGITFDTGYFGYGNIGFPTQAGSHTQLVLMKKGASTVSYQSASSSGNNLAFYTYYTAAQGGLFGLDTTGQGGIHFSGLAAAPNEIIQAGYSWAANVVQTYKNGNPINVNLATTSFSWTNATYDIGRGQTTEYFKSTAFLVLAWNRVLTPTEMASLAANPWQVFVGTATPVDGSAITTPAAISLTAATGLASSAAHAFAVTTPRVIQLVAPTGTARGNARSSSTPPPIQLSAANAEASTVTHAVAPATPATVILTPATGTAGTSHIATTTPRAISLTAATGIASSEGNAKGIGSPSPVNLSAATGAAKGAATGKTTPAPVQLSAATGAASAATHAVGVASVDAIDLIAATGTGKGTADVFISDVPPIQLMAATVSASTASPNPTVLCTPARILLEAATARAIVPGKSSNAGGGINKEPANQKTNVGYYTRAIDLLPEPEPEPEVKVKKARKIRKAKLSDTVFAVPEAPAVQAIVSPVISEEIDLVKPALPVIKGAVEDHEQRLDNLGREDAMLRAEINALWGQVQELQRINYENKSRELTLSITNAAIQAVSRRRELIMEAMLMIGID